MLRKNAKEINEQSEDFDETTLIYFITLVGSDEEVYKSKDIPRKAISIFVVKCKMNSKKHGNVFRSCQELLKFINENTGTNGEGMNVYDLMKLYIERKIISKYSNIM